MIKSGRDVHYSAAEFWEISHAAAGLTQYACEIGARHIENDLVRAMFTKEVAFIGKAVVDDLQTGKIGVEQARIELERERAALYAQAWEYTMLVAGFTAGILQVGTGVAVCKLSLGLGCAVGGLPLMLHGVNNIYENGRNILEGRKDSVGPVRKGYQEAAKRLGGGPSQGNVAYGVFDIGLSVYSLTRMVLRPGTWRLFRYVEADKVRAYGTMSGNAVMFEVGIDMLTGEQVRVEWGK